MRHFGGPATVQLPQRRHDDLHVVLWCRSGRGWVDCAPGAGPVTRHLLSPGRALLVPATVAHAIQLADDTVVHPVLLPAGSSTATPAPAELLVERPVAVALLSLCVAGVSELRPATSDLVGLADRVLRAFAQSGSPTGTPAAAFIHWVSNPPGRQVLLYAALGTSTVVLRPADGAEVTVALQERMALSVPDGLPHRVLTEPEGVTVPVFHDLPDAICGAESAELFHLTDDLRLQVERQFMAATSALRPAGWDDTALSKALSGHLQRAVVARTDGRDCTLGDRLRERVLREPGAAMTVTEWAERAGCSRRTLERDFRRQVGHSVLGWRNAVRAERAAELLAAGHQAKWIARRLGFIHPSAFTRSFRDSHGLTPRDYRARLLAG